MVDSSNPTATMPTPTEQIFQDGDQQEPRGQDDGGSSSSGEMSAPDVWYYADQRGQIGPLSLEELKVRLATLFDAEGTLIWASHLPDWKRARDVPELTRQLRSIEEEPRSEVVSSARGRLAVETTEPNRRESPPLRADGTDSYANQSPTSPVLPFVGPNDRSASGKKPEGRWYTKIATREDALKTVKDASNAFFAVAAIQVALSLLGLGLRPGTEAFFIGVAALYAGLAAWLRYGKTRGAAIGLVALAGGHMEITLLMLPTSGTNIFVAAIALYAAVNGVAATFKLHGRFKAPLEVPPIPLARAHFTARANESVSLEREELPPLLGKVQAAATDAIELRDKPHNYFVRHWRGELSLPISFWTNGVLLTVIAFMINRMVAARPDLPVTIQIFVPAVVICFYVWSYAGIWRAAGKRTPAGVDGWGWSARIATLLWNGFMVLIIVFWAYFLATVSPNLRRNAFQPATSLATNIGSGVDERGNHYLTLNGPIVPGDPERFAQAVFEANNQGYRIDALRLNSPGGPIWEAMAMAVMVRWVENMATVVRKDAKCESACFGLFAAGQRRYIEPTGNPTQIGVHSIYELIKQEGSQGATAFLRKEAGDATILAIRLLNLIGLSDSIIAKIVTTPADQMSYLTIGELLEMGVDVSGYSKQNKGLDDLSKAGNWAERLRKGDLIFLSSALVRADVTSSKGVTVPMGTVVVAYDDVTWDEFDKAFKGGDHPWSLPLCFSPKPPSVEFTHLCNVSYRTLRGDLATAQLPQSSLELIRQGWEEWISVPRKIKVPSPVQ